MKTANMVDIEQSKISESSFIQWINNISRIKKALFLSFIILIVTSCLWPSPFIRKGISFYLTARTNLQLHYGNGVFGNVYLSAGQH